MNRTLVELEGFPAGATDERGAIERLTTFYTAEFARLGLDPEVESRTTEMPFSATLIDIEPGIHASVGIVQGVHGMLIRSFWAQGAIAEHEVEVAACDPGVEP